jgi:hypothetical protein
MEVIWNFSKHQMDSHIHSTDKSGVDKVTSIPELEGF